eukprot:1960857-Ditylum_brightwellii.AAC.1
MSKPSIKDEKELLLKELIAELTACSSLRVTYIDNQLNELADNVVGNSQGTMPQTPLSPDNKNGTSWDKGEPSEVPSNNVAIKHSKIVQSIKKRRGISKAPFHRWLIAFGYK